MTTIDLIRHAESTMNFESPHLIGGRSNHVPLTEKGIQQAIALGRRLKDEGIVYDVWIVSPALRTLETTRIARREMGLDPDDFIVDDTIQELSQGDWEGKPRKEIYTAEVNAERERIGHINFHAPNGENQLMVEQRMVAFIDNCHSLYPGKRIATITHGLSTKCLMRFVQNWDPKVTYYTEIENTAINQVTYSKTHGRWLLNRMNDHAHLLSGLFKEIIP